MNILQLHFLSSVLQGKRELLEEEAQIRAQALNLNNLFSPYLVAEVAPYYAGVRAEKKDTLIRDCADYVGHLLRKKGLITYFIVNEYDNIQVIITKINEELEKTIEETFIDIRNKLQLMYELDSFVGIGPVVKQITEISYSAHMASEMLAYKFTYAEQGVVNIKNLIRFSHSPNYSSNVRFDRVIGCFQDGNLGRMAVRLNELITDIRNRPNVSSTAIRRTFIELTVSVLHMATNADVATDDIIQGLDVYKWILEQQHTEILTDWFIKLCEELHKAMEKNLEQTEESIVLSACQFVQSHIEQQDLSLSAVSDSVGLSTFYFSKLFKKEMGIGINSYISSCRIEHAKRMLTISDLPIAQIALQCGFSTTAYFSQVFKKTTGMTPGEFRRSAKN